MPTNLYEDGEGGAAPGGAATTGSVGNTPGTDTGWGVNPPKKKMVRRKHSVKEFMELTSAPSIDESAPDKDHPIVKEYSALKKHDIKTLRGMIKGQARIIDTSEFTTKDHAVSHYLRSKHGNKKVAAAFGLSEGEIDEAIKGWKNAHSDIMKSRADASAASNSVVLHQLRADGKESGMHDARKSFRGEDEAHAHVENIKKLNPTRKYRYNKYVNGHHMGVVESEGIEMKENFFKLKSFDDMLDEAFNPAKKDPRGGHVAVLVNTMRPEGHPERYHVGFKPNKTSPRGRTQFQIVSSHASSDEADNAKHEYARKMGYAALRKIGEGIDLIAHNESEEVEGNVITEASEYSFLSKSGFKKKGTLSDGGVVHSHPLHGDVIINKHGHWHHVPSGSTREAGFEGSTGTSLQTHLGRLSESEIHRAVSSGMKDLLVSGDHAGFKKVASHLGHSEWQTNPSESDLKACPAAKLQQAHDHMYKGHSLGESVEQIDEVEVQGADRYEYTHGKKPKGFGNWYFSKHKSIDFRAHKEGEDHVSILGTFGDAKKQATQWAKSKGHAVIHVQT